VRHLFTKGNFFIGLLVASLTLSLWWLINRPESEPPWPAVIQGFSFSPMWEDQDPTKGRLPSLENLDADLKLLAGKTHALRTYTVDKIMGEIPRLAQQYGINVALGAWIDKDEEINTLEVDRLINIAQANYRNVVRVMIGNEVLLRGDIGIDALIKHLDHARSALEMPVSTAEPWHIWLEHPELVEHVDYIAVHMLPYWEGVHVDKAVDYVASRMGELRVRFPDKPIVIAEVGWPSHGRTKKSAVASPANEATFLRRFLDHAEIEQYTYYVMEAFDQLWKGAAYEGAVGSYWGVYNVHRQPKFTFTEAIVSIPEWRHLALISVLVATFAFAILLVDSGRLRPWGRGFLALVTYAAITAVVWITYNYTLQYFTASTVVVGILMALSVIGLIVVLLVESHEWAEALWIKDHQRKAKHQTVTDDELPLVSIHLPIHNEPANMVIETLNALSRLDYPRYEVIVIDNNTDDTNTWKPVEQHCRILGNHFHFYHQNPLPGFKAGALNFALKQTASAAEIVAVIDSDYIVESNWLRELAPEFSNQEIAIVQAPQDYHDGCENAFKAMCYAEYRGFFYLGMVTRNERNAIIQHGTMTLVRRSVLEDVGAWGEWCITEDADLGLRIMEAGHQTLYTPKSYGRGVMPDTFISYKKQRYRWAYGAMQILRRHAGPLFFGKRTALTSGQRYHFVAGWLPWISDGINLVFTLAALAWSVAMVNLPDTIDPPLVLFSVLPLTLFTFKLLKIIFLYQGIRIVGTVRQTLAAALAGLALSHTIASAMLKGLFSSKEGFFRTPKLADSQGILQALSAAREETLIGIALLLAAAGIAMLHGLETPDLVLWVLVLTVLSVPYLAAMLMSVISSMPGLRASWLAKRDCASSLLEKVTPGKPDRGHLTLIKNNPSTPETAQSRQKPKLKHQHK
jgi:exo-beta-1,3-glucanase (GH17 family)/cellulose synthase/poly-beta-1,6-N-acetylglucosamine synthase-like glycosyltransferase